MSVRPGLAIIATAFVLLGCAEERPAISPDAPKREQATADQQSSPVQQQVPSGQEMGDEASFGQTEPDPN